MKLFSSIVPYLLLVSSSPVTMNDFGIDRIRVINASPYYGVAVPVIGAYDTEKYIKKDFETAVEVLKKESKKDLWPVIFFNRFIGIKGEKKLRRPKKSGKEYFRAIGGMDIYNETGALQDFINIWKMALSISKELGSPGIVVDPEAYNNRKAYRVSYVAKKTKKSKEEVKERLKKIGRELADITNQMYPDAIIWFLVTYLTYQDKIDKDYRTVTFIIQGMLERAMEKNMKFKMIAGGERSVGYCHKSLDDLKQKIITREKDYVPILSLYPMLHLGGTIAPWNNPELKRTWLLTARRCGNCEKKSIDDFKPLIRHLLDSYNYVWIYAAWAAQYNPYDSEIATPYNKAIGDVINGFREGIKLK